MAKDKRGRRRRRRDDDDRDDDRRSDDSQGDSRSQPKDATLLEQEYGSAQAALKAVVKKLNESEGKNFKLRQKNRELTRELREAEERLFSDEDVLEQHPALAQFDDAKSIAEALARGDKAVKELAATKAAGSLKDVAEKGQLNLPALKFLARTHPEASFTTEELEVDDKTMTRVMVTVDGKAETLESFVKRSEDEGDDTLALLRAKTDDDRSDDRSDRRNERSMHRSSRSADRKGKKDDYLVADYIKKMNEGGKTEDKKEAA